MNKRWLNIILSLTYAILTMIVVSIIFGFTSFGSSLNRMMQIMGGQLIGELFGGLAPTGLVQFFTFWIFYFGILELATASKSVDDEGTAYSFNLLPETEQYVLNPSDVNNIKLKVLDLERKQSSFLLTRLIKKACTKFRSNKSTSEALEIVTAQVRINISNAESEQSMIRYVAWAIPSIGFIGTIIGIAGSLGNVSAEMGNDEIQVVTQSLYVAFDTTLLSLFLSVVLMFYFHTIQEKVEKFHLKMEDYVIENLINRIYKI